MGWHWLSMAHCPLPAFHARHRYGCGTCGRVLVSKPSPVTPRACAPQHSIRTAFFVFAGWHSSESIATVFCDRTSFSRYGNLVVSGSKDRSIKFWDIVSGLCINTYNSHLGEVCQSLLSQCRHTPSDLAGTCDWLVQVTLGRCLALSGDICCLALSGDICCLALSGDICCLALSGDIC